MKRENTKDPLLLSFSKDTVTYCGQTWLTGTLACMALNIDRSVLETTLPFCKRIAGINAMLRTGTTDKTQMASMRSAAQKLMDILSEQVPFTFFAEQELKDRLERAFTVDAFKKTRAYQAAVLEGRVNEKAIEEFGPTVDLVNLGPSLANIYDAVHILQDQVGPFADSLADDSLPRTAEAYLARFNEMFPKDIRIGNGRDTWLAMSNVTLQYIAATPEGKADLQMMKQMHFVSFGGLLRSDFFEGLSIGNVPRRCANCGRWFLATDARHTKYCDDTDLDDELGRTCRQIGNLKGRKQRELSVDHPINRPYERRMNTIDQCLKRGTLPSDVAELMKKLAKDKKQQAKADADYAKGSYLAEMEQKALKAEALRLLGRYGN